MLGGPYEASLVPTSVDWSDRVVIMVTTHFGLLSGLAWAPKKGHLGPKGPFWSPWRAWKGPGGPDLMDGRDGWDGWTSEI